MFLVGGVSARLGDVALGGEGVEWQLGDVADSAQGVQDAVDDLDS